MPDRPIPVSPCCVGRNLHSGPGCVWPREVPADDVLLALGRALWEALRLDDGSLYAHMRLADPEVCIDGHVTLPNDVAAIVRLAPGVQVL